MKSFRISSSARTKIFEFLSEPSSKKISAIKALRAEVKCGLKEAKESIEKIQHDNGWGHYPHASSVGHVLLCGPKIKKLTLDFGEGDIEVDLERMEMIALMKMQKIGLDACGDILDLVATLKAFSDGENIGVINEDR